MFCPVRTITAPSPLVVAPGGMNGAVEKQVRELHAASGASNKRLVIEKGGYQGTDLLRRSDDRTALEAETLAFEGCLRG
ncbi:hypothetical protein E1211_02870 [Micromonospora sp. 15K316]|uniref:hypothetical protein n=1 Tax=Micromonospora sp. 15K316 TaxID=2530376 RepID=UPI0010512CA6|nr:hypothetical protein [Micromonospora sp. 15K316]TDC39949.1 hypothetical protein E1211_02870 [Micromonospora sp. 15K316]